MGLVIDLREKMASISPTHPGSNSGGGGGTTGRSNHHHNHSEQVVVRKKRTFDIAFLTGQSEQSLKDGESESNNNNEIGSQNHNNKRYASPSSISYLSPSEDDNSPYNLTHDGTNSSDTSSMIDVMTNGSLSETESSPATSPRMVHQHHHNAPSAIIPNVTSTPTTVNHSTHHHNNFKGKKSHSRKSPVKEEIRFESKRTIDINHTSDSLKIKENLQFSTLIPSSSSVSPGGTHTQGTGDLTLPQIASTFALFPHMTKFPMGIPSLAAAAVASHHHHHHQQHQLQQNNHNQSNNNSGGTPSGLHFSSSNSSSASNNNSNKLEKCDGINLSYQHSHHLNHHPMSKIRFPDPYAAAAAMAGGYAYPNLIIPQELANIRHAQFSPSGGVGGHGGHQQQHSPPGVGLSMSPSQAATLLPPSLTALTLPAQNVCAKCNIGFRMTSDLVYHMRSHHKRDTFDPLKKQREEKLKCPVCHETFRERHHLTRHMTAHQDRGDEMEPVILDQIKNLDSASSIVSNMTSHK